MRNDASQERIRVDLKYILISAFAVIFTWEVHELAHFLTGESLGYAMGMTLNSAFPVKNRFDMEWHYHLISAAGPFITLVQAVVISLLMRSMHRSRIFPFLFICFYMRFQATIISFFNANDEARISKWLGIGKFTLPLIVTAILFWMVYSITKKYRFSSDFIWWNILFAIVFCSLIILSDQFFKLRLL
jgi:uncharacterized membrane protein